MFQSRYLKGALIYPAGTWLVPQGVGSALGAAPPPHVCLGPPWDLKNTRFSGFLTLNYVICIFPACFLKIFAMWENRGSWSLQHGSELASWASKGGTGGPGRVSRSRKISGGRPPRNDDRYFSIIFLDASENFAFSTIFKTKWSKSEEKLKFGGRWVWVPMNPSSPNKTSWRRPWLA